MRTTFVLAMLAAALLFGAAAFDRAYPPDLTRQGDRSTVVLDSQGRILRAFTTADGMWRLATMPDDVDPRYLALLLDYEDRRFHDHAGVDPFAVLRAAWQVLRHGHVVSGASTLTMQTARLLEPRPRGLRAKLAEMARAMQLESRYDKREILSLYLTLAPFGGNIEGVRAASLSWFGKEPKHLTLAESALLVVLPQSPERVRPDLFPAVARAARDKVLRRAREHGVITPREAAEAMQGAIPIKRAAMPFRAPHLAEQLRGASAPGSVIRTTVDGRLQRIIEELASREARWLGDGANLAIVVVENRGRAVRTWLGGADFFGANGQVDLTRAKRSPGSTLKPFVYALAFDDGIAHPETLIDDAPVRFGDYAPRNFDRDFQGEVTIRRALQQSLNVPAIVALDRIGTARFVSLLREGGAALEFDRTADAPSLPVALGGVGISLADLTMLYAALADGGLAQPLRVRADVATAPPHRLVNANAAWQVIDILSGVTPPEPWAQAKRIGEQRRIAYKTGTSYGFRDAWAIGVTPTWTVGVWVGRADGTPRPGQYGRSAAAPILFKAFDLLPGEDLAPVPPEGVLLVGTTAQLPPSLRKLAAAGDVGGPRRERAPRILFPPDGATIELPREHGRFATVALKAEGTGALDWVVNGAPLQGPAFWQPDGEGFARIVVLDRAGRSTAARIRVVPAPD